MNHSEKLCITTREARHALLNSLSFVLFNQKQVSGLGIFLIFLGFSNSLKGQEIISFGESWEYLHPLDGRDPSVADPDFGDTWFTPSQYDGSPFQGPSPALLGYGNIDLKPVTTNIGEPPRGARYSTYFRKTITTTQRYDRLKVELLADDGGVLYVDGELVERFNFSGPDSYFALSDSAGNEARTEVQFLERNLEAGEHVIAFALHNVTPTSSDLGFDLQITGVAAPTPLDGISWSINDDEVTITSTDRNVVGDLVIPDTIEGFPVTKIHRFALAGSLWSSVRLPANLKEIGRDAFTNCGNLIILNIPPGVEKIGDSAFRACGSLEGLTIPEGITKIGNSVFEGCARLSSITIPTNVTEIKSRAFFNCRSITHLEIGENVETIGDEAFHSCFSLSSVDMPDRVTRVGASAFRNCTGLISAPLGTNTTLIESSTFEGCTGLVTLDIPNFINEIGDSGFKGCTNLATISLGESIVSIGNSCFENCPNLNDVLIPDSVNELGASTFSNCTSLENMTLGTGLQAIGSKAFWGTQVMPLTAGNLKYMLSDVAAFVVDHNAARGDVFVPSILGDLPVRSLSGFDGNALITSIQLPGTLRGLGASAFQDCWELTMIDLPIFVEIIGHSAFEGCWRIDNVALPNGLRKLGPLSFSGTNLVNLTIPDSVVKIGDSAFEQCITLESVDFGNSLVEVGKGAFQSCGNLIEASLPATVISIEESAFEGCGLETFIIPEGITKIEASTFESCFNLSEILIPEGIQSIGLSAFRDCHFITNIVIPESVTELGGSAFSRCRRLASAQIEGSSFIIRFHGETGVIDWRLMGSTQMQEFHNDLSADTNFSEISPGVYEASFNTFNNPTVRFFRVER